MARLQADQGEAKMNRLDKAAVRRTFSDWKIYIGVFQYMGVVTTGYSGSFFIPTIINELGYKAQAAQVRTIPIYIVATVAAVCVAIATDKLKHRYGFCMAGIIVATVGFIMLLAQHDLSVGVKYFALFLIVTGGYMCQPVCLTWIQNCMGGHYKRSIASAMQVGFGNWYVSTSTTAPSTLANERY
jgi:cyanate permease